jgi:hypothetical protein
MSETGWVYEECRERMSAFVNVQDRRVALHARRLPDDRRECLAGSDPNVATATAMASSKLLPAAVNDSAAVSS